MLYSISRAEAFTSYEEYEALNLDGMSYEQYQELLESWDFYNVDECPNSLK